MSVLEVVYCVISFVLGLFLKEYLPTYAKEKAKNLATKEDIADITLSVERVRAGLTKESLLLEKRRAVYEQISNSLRVFISGHSDTQGIKEQFHSTYSLCWLWAPDQILKKLNEFIKMQVEIREDPKAYPQDEVKKVFNEIMLCMRRDVGFPETVMGENSYQFVRF